MPPPDLEATDEVAIVLRITIDLEGQVTEAEVVEGAGDPYDAMAQDALRRSRFEPARRGGEPIVARVLYRWIFRPPPPAPVADPATADGDGAPPDASAAPDPSGPDAGPTGPSPNEVPAAPDPDAPSPDPAAPTEAPADEAAAAEAEDDFLDDGDVYLSASARTDRDREGILERSTEAVNVVDIAAERDRARDLGDVLARQEGIALQRSGGLGSRSRISIAGLTDLQIRFFIDDIPLELFGITNLANLPVGPIEAVDIYRGVLPIRLGADALGGALNIRTGDAARRTYGQVSYQVGSYGTHRTAAVARYYDEETGLTVGFRGFYDQTANDYRIDVEVPDSRGRLSPARVRRFHDDYRGYNGTFDIGVFDRPWARRLQLSVFASGAVQDLQHNTVMTIPYGEVEQQEHGYGAVLRYDVDTGPVSTDVILSLGWSRAVFDDRGDQVYDWFGQTIRERRVPGEIQGQPIFQTQDRLIFYSRLHSEWTINDEHAVEIATTPRLDILGGEDRLFDQPDLRDPLDAQQDLGRIVTGLSHRWSPWNGRLENTIFVKHYYYDARAEQVLPGNVFRSLDRRNQYGGAGNGVRLNLAEDYLWLKASYEYAARLPTPTEVFGDGRLIQSNLELVPERSHNLNVTLHVDHRDGPAGAFKGQANVFLRRSQDLIVLLGNDQFFTYQNVFGVRSIGVEASLSWTSPGNWVSLLANTTYVDNRNVSDQGAFGDFEGDRIPNRPYLFANGSAAFNWNEAFARDGTLRLGGDVRFVEEFFRGWESQGLRAFKQTVDRQVTFGAFVSYAYRMEQFTVRSTFDVQNIADARVFDFFGVQRPGRAYFLKVLLEYDRR